MPDHDRGFSDFNSELLLARTPWRLPCWQKRESSRTCLLRLRTVDTANAPIGCEQQPHNGREEKVDSMVQ